MKFLLTSAGITNNSIEKALFDLAGRPLAELSLAFVPTASNLEVGDKQWLLDDLSRLRSLGFKNIETVDISLVCGEDLKQKLSGFDVMYFEGGDTSYLMKWVRESGLAAFLPELLKSKIYIGVSAGSMIVGKSLDCGRSEELYDEKCDPAVGDEGLGYADFIIRPHVNSDFFTKVKLDTLDKIAKTEDFTSYALDDGSALMIDDEKLEVVSEGVWKKYN